MFLCAGIEYDICALQYCACATICASLFCLANNFSDIIIRIRNRFIYASGNTAYTIRENNKCMVMVGRMYCVYKNEKVFYIETWKALGNGNAI